MDKYTSELKTIILGQLINAVTSAGIDITCQVVSIAGDVLSCHDIMRNDDVRFSLTTGYQLGIDTDRRARIQSIARVPTPVQETLLTLQRRMLAHTPTRPFKLTEHEKDALLFIGEFYEANPITSLPD